MNPRVTYNEGKWEEVIKIGSVLSRPLWVTGKCKLRVEIGKLVESAAAYSHHHKEQASALIDDLGWTIFVLGNVKTAKKNILHGLEIAEEFNYYYLLYKGHRHLSGIALQEGNLNKAEVHLSKAMQYSERIKDKRTKREVTAGFHFHQALIAMEKRKWEKALQELEVAQNMYRELADKDRYVKLYHYRGDVLLEMGNLDAAKDVYRTGLSAAIRESRKDGILKNNLGLAKIAIREGDVEEAKRAYSDAAKVARELGRVTLAKELETNVSKPPLKPIEVKF